MPDRPYQKIITWLCVAVTLLAGDVPGQAWVLCLEPGGQIALELASEANRCGGCPGATGDHRDRRVPVADPSECPCIDIPLVLDSQQDELQRKQIEDPVHGLTTTPAAVVSTCQPALAPLSRPRPDSPRPVHVLALIRSVVLLV
jgi:hypothetical protein